MSVHSYIYLMTGIRIPENEIDWDDTIEKLLDEEYPEIIAVYGEGAEYVYIGKVIHSVGPYDENELSEEISFPDKVQVEQMIKDINPEYLTISDGGVKNWMFQTYE